MSLRKDIQTDLKNFSNAAPIGENIFTEAKGSGFHCPLNRPAPGGVIGPLSQMQVPYHQGSIASLIWAQEETQLIIDKYGDEPWPYHGFWSLGVYDLMDKETENAR
jgi:hypothetical protein